MYEKVENHPHLARDTNSKGIINIDNKALVAYKRRKQSMNELQNDVSDLKSEMTEIKQLLFKLVNNINS